MLVSSHLDVACLSNVAVFGFCRENEVDEAVFVGSDGVVGR